MKKNIFLILFSLLIISGGFDASGQTSSDRSSDKTQINIIPPSPEASTLGSYGEIPFGYYTGTVNFNIPVAEITAGKVSVPVSLNYSSGEGIKVGDVANNVGLGWQIGGLGVITRAVMGRADDYGGFLTAINEYDRTFTNGIPPASFDFTTVSNTLENWYWASQYCIDLQPDIFYYNFGNYAGKFFFDWNGEIINMSNSPIKIEYNKNSNGNIIQWIITIEDGTKYTFSSTETTTETDPLSINDPNCGYVNGPKTFTSSWYLSKIEDPNQNSVSFLYEPYSYRLMDMKSQQFSFQSDYTIAFNTCVSVQSPHHRGDRKFSYSINPTTYYQKRISKITSSNGQEIKFYYNTPRKDTQTLQALNSFKSLDSIVLLNNSTPIKSWGLKHDYFTGRLTLRKVTINGNNQAAEKHYLFSYNDSIPKSIASYAIDHWGYFNGRTNNLSLVPSFIGHIYPASVNDPSDIPVPYVGGNREVDTSACLKGLLTDIVYPTGGSTRFIYEANDCSRAENKPIADYNLHPKSWYYSTIRADADSSSGILKVAVDTIIIPTVSNIALEYQAYINGSCSGPKKPKMFIKKLVNGTLTTIKQIQFNYTNDTPIVGPYFTTEFREFQPGTYIFMSEAQCADVQTHQPDYASISLYFEIEDTTVTYSKIPVGGARIKRIENFDPVSNKTVSKQFYYTIPGSPGLSSGIIYDLPQYTTHKSSSDLYEGCSAGPGSPDGPSVTISPLEVHLSRNKYQLGTTNGSHIGYEWVTIVTDDEGKKEFQYTNPAMYPDDIDLRYPFMSAGSQSYKTGLLLSEKDYSFKNGNYNLVREAKNNYNFMDSGTVAIGVFFNGNREMGSMLISMWFPLDYSGAYSKNLEYIFKFDSCKLNTGYSRLVQQTETFYYPDSISTITDNFYHPTVPQLLKSKQTKNSDGIISKTAYTYPPDMAASSVKTAMLNQNMIGLPVSTKTYNNGTLTATELNNYDLFNGSQVQLKSKQSSTYNNALQTEVTFNKYDAKGNLLSYTTRQGISTVILWGYNSAYPVAQIEHVDTAALTTYLDANPAIQATCNSPASDQALRGVIQQIRTQFPNAIITGMTYRPPLGMTSKTGPNNMATYYDYDGFGRLADIKDKDGRILKKYTYHYRPQ
ncbi:MAG TPA: hypothetical protein VFL76_00965 [Edaphocola sp.]|nr:hypothetical protein [Edaphocola sp.]